jgi:hypothetical protein
MASGASHQSRNTGRLRNCNQQLFEDAVHRSARAELMEKLDDRQMSCGGSQEVPPADRARRLLRKQLDSQIGPI